MDYYEIIISVLQRWYSKFAQATPRIVVGLLLFTLILLMSSYLSKITVRIFHKFFPKSKSSSVVALVNFFKFLIVLGGTFLDLEIMGLGGLVMKFLGSLGVAGVIAGVALKDLVSSIFSGALVGMDKAFAKGDYVSIKDVTGRVEDIGFLTTKIITDEGKKVYVPNQLIFSAPFINYSASGQRRVFLDLQISNQQDLEKAIQLILDEIKGFSFAEPAEKSEVIVLKQELGIFYLEARFYMKKGENLNRVRTEAFTAIKKKLDENKIPLATKTDSDD